MITTLIAAPQASASSRTSSCTADGDTLQSWVYYEVQDQHVQINQVLFRISGNTRKHNDVDVDLLTLSGRGRSDLFPREPGRANPDVWGSWFYYPVTTPIRLPVAYQPILTFWVRFDQWDIDDSCSFRLRAY
jgi:hypothetical protein